jgi:uncharacterized protein (TIGR02646 family)
MRDLTKIPEPRVLQDNAVIWTQEYKAAIAVGTKPQERWRNRDITSALGEETYGKCAYCEAFIKAVAYPHVEHIIPKSVFADLVYSWENLTLACPVCNTNKGNYYSAADPLLHPYKDDPPLHIIFRGPMIQATLGDVLGERTILRLDLKRSELLVQRLVAIEAFHGLLQRWQEASGPDKDLREMVVRDALGDDKEFTCCLRAYAESMGFILQPTIPTNV